MKVMVRLFAAARQAAGQDRLELELPEGATVGDLRRALSGQLPELADLVRRAMFAVDTEYAPDDRTLPRDAEVACIPPVSGG